MLDIMETRQKLRQLRCCVLIPTYNNEHTLEQIIRGVRVFSDDIIVVNDGSTDHTAEILDRLSQEMNHHSENVTPLIRYTLSSNSGKGCALRQGFRIAMEKGYRYAITLDSDGQHFPEDIPKFVEKVHQNPNSIIIGARNMSQDDVPGTSSFGHKFSIFWFRVETGMTISDVQSGYRLYPLKYIRRIRKFYSTKFEFEIEVLVRLAWRGAAIHSVPIKVYYAPKGERVSHFRKGRDFACASLVNAILVFMAILWIRPFLFAKDLRKKSIKGFIREVVLESKDSNAKIAWSVALGVMIGVSPFWGWQSMIVLGLAYTLKLNKLISFAAANISIPPNMPWILFLSYYMGGLVMGNETGDLSYSSKINLEWISGNLLQYITGSFVFGFVLGPFFGLITYFLLILFRKKNICKEQLDEPL
jgi:glycosyltransferase involved in cell wall biosynthesis